VNKSEAALVEQAEALLDEFFDMAGDLDTNRLMKIGEWWRLVVIARFYSDEIELNDEEIALLREGEKLWYLSQGEPNLPFEKIAEIREAINANQREADIALGLCCCIRVTNFLCGEKEAVILFRIACERLAYAIISPDSPELAAKLARLSLAKLGAEALHSKPGGSRDKKEKIRDIWASGKYSSRDICAEQECAALNWSFSAARRALRNTPDVT
jgi:hypothetical protein